MHKRKKSEKISQAEWDGDIFIAAKLTPTEKKEADRQLAEARKKNKKPMTEEVRVGLIHFCVRFRIEDSLQNKEYDPAMTFGHFLKQYVDLLEIKQKEFADQIGIDETLLSQLINGHRMPPDYLIIRLEIHSNNDIPADFWYRLVEREKGHFIRTDKEIRKIQAKYVHTGRPRQKAEAEGKHGRAVASAKNGQPAAGPKNSRSANKRPAAGSRSRIKAL
jgi:plasmid maintenance system antidote protein VapI